MENLTTLIVDDHKLFREGMESLLRKVPYVGSVHHAPCGLDALEMVKSISPGLIFMDIRMPDISGIEVTKRIRRDNTEVKIIALTMMEDSQSIVNMMKAGANGYLLKNTSFNELTEAIEAVRNGEKYYSKDVSHILVGRLVGDSIFKPKSQGKTEITPRERDIIGLICRGFTNREISELLNIAVKTVEGHRSNVYSKLDISNAADLAYFALKEGIVKRNE